MLNFPHSTDTDEDESIPFREKSENWLNNSSTTKGKQGASRSRQRQGCGLTKIPTLGAETHHQEGVSQIAELLPEE